MLGTFWFVLTYVKYKISQKESTEKAIVFKCHKFSCNFTSNWTSNGLKTQHGDVYWSYESHCSVWCVHKLSSLTLWLYALFPVAFGQVLRFLREFLLSEAKNDPKINSRLYKPFQTTTPHVRWIIFGVLSMWTFCPVSMAVYRQVLRFQNAFLPIGAVKWHQNTLWDIDPSW